MASLMMRGSTVMTNDQEDEKNNLNNDELQINRGVEFTITKKEAESRSTKIIPSKVWKNDFLF